MGTTYVAPPEPTQEEIEEKARKNEEASTKQAHEAMLKRIPHPGSWLKEGCTYHVEACKTMVPKAFQKDVEEDNYEAGIVSQYDRGEYAGQWYVYLKTILQGVDPKNIVRHECVAKKCPNGANCSNL